VLKHVTEDSEVSGNLVVDFIVAGTKRGFWRSRISPRTSVAFRTNSRNVRSKSSSCCNMLCCLVDETEVELCN